MDKKLFENIKVTTLLFIAVVLLGFVLRFYLLGSVPVSMHRDEAFLGYNAYSILKTGKDMSGSFLPVHLESFFYSPAGYSYFSIPFIEVFGLSEFSVRFASALFGTLTIPLVFLISLNLFKENKGKYWIALSSAFILSVMPWHVNLSRVAIENTVVVFFITLGIYLYLKYIERKKSTLLILSFLSFGINFFIYQAPRAFVPLFIPFLILILADSKNLIKNKIQIVLYSLFIIIPVAFILFSPQLSWRIQSLSIFNHPETKLTIQEQLTNDGVLGVPSFVSRAFHNKVSGYSLLFLDNYFSHLSYNFLFSDGGLPNRFKIPDVGLLYVYQLPLIIIAFLYLHKKNPRLNLFFFGWVGLALLGSALTYDDVPNFQRTLMAVPPFSILSGYGLYEFLAKFKNNKYHFLIFAFSLSVITVSFSYFLIQYFIQGKVYQTWNRQDGYRMLVKVTNEMLPNYEKAVVTSRESAPSVFFLFYSKYDPALFQKETEFQDLKKSDHISFGKFEFSDEECPLRVDEKTQKFLGKPGILYVNSSLCKEDISSYSNQLYVVKRTGGFSDVFYIYEAK